MANHRKLDKVRPVYYCSSSISNFKEKIAKWSGLEEWSYFKLFRPAIFFGLYHWKDYVRFILHRGRKKVFWCGTDILHLGGQIGEKDYRRKGWYFWQFILNKIRAKHYCENNIERAALEIMGMESEITPVMFADIPEVSFEHSDKPKVVVCGHPDSVDEYGLTYLQKNGSLFDVEFHVYGLKPWFPHLWPENMIFHGIVSEKQFNQEMQGYQAAIRLNTFDGFSEVIAKSILMGQYPITTAISYPMIDYETKGTALKEWFKQLKNKTEPNYKVRKYWLKELERSKDEIINSW